MSMDIRKYKKTIIALRPSLITIAHRIVGNFEDAEDVVQDVCLKIWHEREKVGKLKNVEAYSTTMVKNLCIDTIRSRKKIINEMILVNQADDEKMPDSLLEVEEIKEAIRRIIQLLPPFQQRILKMKDIEGYETAEIASIMEIAPEAVRNNLSRARKKLRELYMMYYNIKQGELK